MGTDNLFHKRKAKQISDLARRKDRRAPYARVLIVCEGEKTEPLYFNGLKDHYELNSANVEVCGDCGSDPCSIVEYARQQYRESKDIGDAYDRIFCVFDKDSHTGYDEALDALRNVKPKGLYMAITSVPCFEYWLLLHFIYTTAAFVSQPGNSACNQLLHELREYIPSYSKGRAGIFSELTEQMDFAISNAKRALTAAETVHTDNPTTCVHELVAYLQNIKGSQ